jgi:hypothetical protein
VRFSKFDDFTEQHASIGLNDSLYRLNHTSSIAVESPRAIFKVFLTPLQPVLAVWYKATHGGTTALPKAKDHQGNTYLKFFFQISRNCRKLGPEPGWKRKARLLIRCQIVITQS